MKSDGLKYFTDLQLPLVGLLIFFSLFIVLTWMQIRRYDKNRISVMEKLPMEGD